jgi:hypothetical protein
MLDWLGGIGDALLSRFVPATTAAAAECWVSSTTCSGACTSSPCLLWRTVTTCCKDQHGKWCYTSSRTCGCYTC